MSIKAARAFVGDECGATTVDWVVLTAATVGMALASVVAVGSGQNRLGEMVGASLSGASVAAPCQSSSPSASDYQLTALVGDRSRDAEYHQRYYGRLDDETLTRSYAEQVQKINEIRRSEPGEDIAEQVDYLAIMAREMEARRLTPRDDTPGFAQVHQSIFSASGGCSGTGTGPTIPDYRLVGHDPVRDADHISRITDDLASTRTEKLRHVVTDIEDQFHRALAERQRDEAARQLDYLYLAAREMAQRGDAEAAAEAMRRFERAQEAWNAAR